jgi:hypothetical protein
MKFKRHICLLFAFFLLVSNLGMAFSAHYCGDELASVSLKTSFSSQNSEESCCGEAIEKKEHCCKDKVVRFQKKADNVIVKSFSFSIDAPFQAQEWNPIVVSLNSNFKSSQITSYYCDVNAPPFFKLYHQYVFYA